MPAPARLRTRRAAVVDREIAEHALGSEEIRRLMTIPGVDITTASTLVAVIGDIGRFPTPKYLVGYLGLHPKLRQSGSSPARYGPLSKEGSRAARHVLVEAAWSAAKSPGPLRAFALRTAARRGKNVATVAVARKLSVLCWHLLTKREDYAFQRPALVRDKLRRLELRGRAAAQARAEQGARVGIGGRPPPRSRGRRAGRGGLSPLRRQLADERAEEDGARARHRGARIVKAV